jgi:hypothetical protein
MVVIEEGNGIPLLTDYVSDVRDGESGMSNGIVEIVLMESA